jgi:acetyl esterase/lipase
MSRQLALAVLTLTLAASVQAAEPITLHVWPDKPPADDRKVGPEEYMPEQPGQRKVARLTNVSVPTISVYQPPEDQRTGAAVVICPGGGYRILAMDLEGTEVAEWLNSIGVTGIVLKYRVPVPSPTSVPRGPLAPRADDPAATPLAEREGHRGTPEAPLQDVQRAISLVRSKASEWQIDPARIGVLGFSAGGNLAATACLQHASRKYDKMDDADSLSCRPDFGVLIYPGYLIDDDGNLKPEYKPTSDTPPIFFAHAYNDGVKPENSIALFLALKQAGVGGELHIYSAGGHGFGLRKSDDPCSTWPARCNEWLAKSGILSQRK